MRISDWSSDVCSSDLEYAGDAITSLNMAGRMTVCNMSIEAGARAGMIAPDHVTFEYLRGRQFAPAEGDFEAACALWRALHSDQGAKFDRIADIDAADRSADRKSVE